MITDLLIPFFFAKQLFIALLIKLLVKSLDCSSYINECLAMKMDCVDISQISKSHQVPGHFLIPVHFQPG